MKTQAEAPEEEESAQTHKQKWDAIHALVDKEDWETLNGLDELRTQIDEKKALIGWNLPKAMFAPTFKVLRDEKRKYTVRQEGTMSSRSFLTVL